MQKETPPLPTPLLASTHTRTPRLLANGEPHQRTVATGDLQRATGMDVEHDPQEQEIPPETPFDEGFTPFTTRGYTSADPTGGVHTENFFIPLYTESQ